MTEYHQGMNLDSAPFVVERRLDPYTLLTPAFIGIVDTDALLSSVKNDCEHGSGWRSRMLRITDRQTSFLYAADHVYVEVHRRLPKVAKSSSVSPEELRSRFEEQYLPAIRFVTLSADQPYDEQVASVTDLTDVPTAQLAKLVAPCVVFSGDKHLRKPGIAPTDWRVVVIAGVELAEAGLRTAVATNSVILPAQGAAKVMQAVAKKVGVAPWLVASLTAGAAAVYLASEARRTKLKAFTGSVGMATLTQLAEALEEERRATQDIRPALLATRVDASTKQQIATLLARQSDPLLAGEIHQLIDVHFDAESSSAVTEVRTILREDPEFIRAGRYRWQLGRERGPFRPC